MWLALLFAAVGPTFAEAEPYLGTYRAGPESISFRWENGLVYHHGNIAIPADGAWHETVPEFAVRHRVTWIPEAKAFSLEETHDRSQPWRYVLRLAEDSGLLEKVLEEDGGSVVVRSYVRETVE